MDETPRRRPGRLPKTPKTKKELKHAEYRSTCLEASIELGRRLRQAREKKGFSQAEACRRLELSQPFLSDVERGEDLPSLQNLARMAVLYEAQLSKLIPQNALWANYHPA